MSILNASNENSLWTICFADNSLHPQPSYLLLFTSYIFPLPSYIFHLTSSLFSCPFYSFNVEIVCNMIINS